MGVCQSMVSGSVLNIPMNIFLTGSLHNAVCGSQGIASAVRSALRFPVSGPKSILKGGASVTLHVESFGHA